LKALLDEADQVEGDGTAVSGGRLGLEADLVVGRL